MEGPYLLAGAWDRKEFRGKILKAWRAIIAIDRQSRMNFLRGSVIWANSRFSNLVKLLSCLGLGAMFGLLLISPSFSLAQNVTAQVWNEVGAGSATDGGISNDPSGAAGAPDMAVNPANGDIYVAWESGNEEIFVLRWNEATDEWVEVGGGSAAAGGISQTPDTPSTVPAIAVRASDGNVFVVWREGEVNDDLYAAQFNGTAWVRLGADNGRVSNSPEDDLLSQFPDIILPPNNADLPVVAWQEEVDLAPGHNLVVATIYVRRWTGLSWAEMGSGSASSYPDPHYQVPLPDLLQGLEFDLMAAGINADDGFANILPDEGNWHAGGYKISGPQLALDDLGNPAVIFIGGQDRGGNIEYRHGIHIRKFSGNHSLPAYQAWEDVGRVPGGDPGADTNFHARALSVAGTANGLTLYVAADLNFSETSQFELQALLWTGNGWSQRGLLPIAEAISPFGGFVPIMWPSLGLTQDNQLVAAWTQITLNSEIYARQSATDSGGAIIWPEVGEGSASGGGISDNPGLSGFPNLVVYNNNGQDQVVVAWQDGAGAANATPQIYVRRANILPSAAPVIISALVQEATVGQPFAYQIEATGNPHTLDASGLPDELVFANDGRISGAPTQSGTFQVTLRATNSQGTGSAILELIVLAPASSDLLGGGVGGIIEFPAWRTSPWYLNYNVEFWPWIYHDEHGWQYVFEGAPEGTIFVWDPGLEAWLFFTENTYRWMFIFGDNPGWIWAFADNTPDRRFFQRLDDGNLFSIPAGLPTD